MNAKRSGSGAVQWLASRDAAERAFAELVPVAAALEPSIIAQSGTDGFCVGCGKRGWMTQPDSPPGDWANLREGLLCRCGLNSRMRQILVTLDALLEREPSLHEAVLFVPALGRAAGRERVGLLG